MLAAPPVGHLRVTGIPPSPNGQPGIPINVRFSLQPGPNDTMWVGVHFEAPMTAYMIVLPPDMAMEMAPNFAKGLIDAARQAQQHRKSALIVPPHARNQGIDRV